MAVMECSKQCSRRTCSSSPPYRDAYVDCCVTNGCLCGLLYTQVLVIAAQLWWYNLHHSLLQTVARAQECLLQGWQEVQQRTPRSPAQPSLASLHMQTAAKQRPRAEHGQVRNNACKAQPLHQPPLLHQPSLPHSTDAASPMNDHCDRACEAAFSLKLLATSQQYTVMLYYPPGVLLNRTAIAQGLLSWRAGSSARPSGVKGAAAAADLQQSAAAATDAGAPSICLQPGRLRVQLVAQADVATRDWLRMGEWSGW